MVAAICLRNVRDERNQLLAVKALCVLSVELRAEQQFVVADCKLNLASWLISQASCTGHAAPYR